MWSLFFYQILKEKQVVHFFWAFYYYLLSLTCLLFSWLTYVLLCLFNKAVLHIITQMILNVLLRLTPIFLFESEINRKKLQKKELNTSPLFVCAPVKVAVPELRRWLMAIKLVFAEDHDVTWKLNFWILITSSFYWFKVVVISVWILVILVTLTLDHKILWYCWNLSQ